MKHDLIDRVYRMYGREIYLYLYSLSKDHSLAEELRQETFLKAILSLPDSHTNVRAWLYTVARNLFYNTAKREGRRSAFSKKNAGRNPTTPEIPKTRCSTGFGTALFTKRC